MRISFIFIIIFSFIMNTLYSTEKEIDSIKTYRLGEIITISDKIKMADITSSVDELNYYKLHSIDANNVAEIGYYIPSTITQVNSRGETQLFLRGAGERQLGLFFDGVMLNVPWDNRLDLSTIPTDIIGKITVNKGSSSILFGPNILGGALNINTIERRNEGLGFTARVQSDEANSQLVSLTGDGKYGDMNFIANVSYNRSAGLILPRDNQIGVDSLNQDRNSALRSNTQFERISAYGRAEYKFKPNFTLGASLNFYDVSKGVAPLTEGAPSDIRYWKYPEIKRNIITLNGEYLFNKDLFLNFVFWMDQFNQTIDSYTDFSYSKLEEKQFDDDLTLGTRISLQYNLMEDHSLTFAFNGFKTDHNEIIQDPMDKVISDKDFAQQTLSTGLQYKGVFNDVLISAGTSIDYNANPKTGDFIEYEGLGYSDYGAFIGAKYLINENLNLFINSSRRTRFPTMRESFSGALGKFKVNPDLKPETGLINELGINYNSDIIDVNLVGFATFYNDLIEKIRLPIEIDSLGRKQRVNFANATVSGVELTYSFTPNDELFTNGYITYMNSSGENDGEELPHLEYKPEIMALFNLGYKFNFGFTPRIEIQYFGQQWGKDPDDKWRKLEGSLLFNLRLSYNLMLNNNLLEIYVRCNNLTDELYWSKIGLPNSGRTLLAGIIARI